MKNAFSLRLHLAFALCSREAPSYRTSPQTDRGVNLANAPWRTVRSLLITATPALFFYPLSLNIKRRRNCAGHIQTQSESGLQVEIRPELLSPSEYSLRLLFYSTRFLSVLLYLSRARALIFVRWGQLCIYLSFDTRRGDNRRLDYLYLGSLVLRAR